ncbi:MAG TPA: PQQ-binding-like beta-propeller repeat protein [Solirubrobacteraceae bacterium]|jgi:outer membrane protein assembly factor BamB|nr:PQQ-binding-like beta-propeller repeat protein [Solirubrobacteraceae bacterium]
MLSHHLPPDARRPLTLLLALPALLALVGAAAISLPAAAAAEPAWTTYHRDSIRSGYDPEASTPVTPTLAWHSPDLGAPIWSQPLVLGSRVYAATVGDKVFALDSATGAIVWERSVGTPVPASALACGDIEPTVGIVSTPVIDQATGTIYAVADTWDGTHAHHELVGLSLSNGAEVLRTAVDPPGADATQLLQRSALNLDEGNVVFGFGDNYGSCSGELAPLVVAPESGGAARFWQDHAGATHVTSGGVWETSGVAVDGSGAIYAATANPVPPEGEPATVYDFSNSVLQLSLGNFVSTPSASPAPTGWFEPPNWEELSNHDLDLGTAGPELLPGGLIFQAGKDGRGYLISQSALSATPGAPAVFEAQVCGGSGSFGGDAFADGVIYIPCTSGVQALTYNQAAQSFTSLWKGPVDAFGPPTLSAGTVWDIANGGFKGGGTKLYGLDPATGAVRYTLTLPSPVADHFASSSAAGGKLFLATGSSEAAFQIATPTTTGGGAAPIATGVQKSRPSRVPTLLHTRLRADRKGRVRLALRCLLTGGQCKGMVTLRAKFVTIKRKGKKRARQTSYVTLGHVRFNHKKGSFAVTLRLGPKARALLRRHGDRLSLQVILAAPPSKTVKRAATLTAAR